MENELQKLDNVSPDLIKEYDLLNDGSEGLKAENVKILSILDKLQNVEINSKAVG